MNAPYQQNPHYKENLIHKTCSGNFVRSKSEVLIDMILFKNKIPFRYECSLSLGSTIYYPDFTILHPVTKEFFLWEHFGRMDEPSYAKNVAPKLNAYISHGYIPSINLITTYETKEHPLSPVTVENLVEEYFL